MHHFCSRKYSFCHQFLKKELLPNIHHLHLSARSFYLVLESIREEVFLITFSIVGPLLCEQSSILEELLQQLSQTVPVSGDFWNEVRHVIYNSKELLYLFSICELVWKFTQRRCYVRLQGILSI